MHVTYSSEPRKESAADPDGSAGAPACEIEVTPAMIEAGLPHLLSFNAEFSDEEAILVELFRSMYRAALAY